MAALRKTHQVGDPRSSAMASAFLQGLRKRVERDPSGEIVLPVGTVAAADVSCVLRAIDRARLEEDRRC
jgi:hypothetical protein